MEDPLTDTPPPSRFFPEDLNNFSPPLPSITSPSLSFSEPNTPHYPSLFIVAMSSPSLHLFHHISSKTLIGTLLIPEGSSKEKSKSCNIYAMNDGDGLVSVVSIEFVVPEETCHAVAKLLIGDKIVPERVLLLDSIKSQNFRGRLSPDETFGFKLETVMQRLGGSMLKEIEYFPSGSMADGLAAALIARCQMKKMKGTLCVTWPEHGGSAVSFVKSMIIKDVLPHLKIGVDGNLEGEYGRFAQIKSRQQHWITCMWEHRIRAGEGGGRGEKVDRENV
ncbi:hypothetical protein RJ641_012347 [Dillenia turbinata]|uniref:Uncharacterized protein n=1 Tax=Dillenia turbinata TaxID=194707 RepID=A0AAN8Z3W1_9MAGN